MVWIVSSQAIPYLCITLILKIIQSDTCIIEFPLHYFFIKNSSYTNLQIKLTIVMGSNIVDLINENVWSSSGLNLTDTNHFLSLSLHKKWLVHHKQPLRLFSIWLKTNQFQWFILNLSLLTCCLNKPRANPIKLLLLLVLVVLS